VADFIARTAVEGLHGLTGASTVVENRPSAAGNIALEAVAKAAPTRASSVPSATCRSR
jgi:tripartite-type tricarboxylate transporter receptor subunit TctC